MADLVPVRRALLSVSDKRDLVPFARGLSALGIEIISTGGTARELVDAGINVTPIDQVTGYPEMLDGRVKTLHPAVHGGILARRDISDHMDALEAHRITTIDLICINLYPFEQTIRREGVTNEEAIEQIDIGGPAMLRSASKNFDWVTVITSPGQYDRVITELKSRESHTTRALRREFAAVAFSRTAEYDTAISAWMSTGEDEALPPVLRQDYIRSSELRYGENPHQRAAAYTNPASHEISVLTADVLHGKALSYNNLNDAAAALELVADLHASFSDHTAAAVIKHANPCGAAIAASPAQAFADAYAGDPLAAYGGILAVSRPVDAATAAAIADGTKFLEVIVAPSFDDDALATLAERWKNVRLLVVGDLHPTHTRRMQFRSVPGGMLVQDRDNRLPDTASWQHVAGPAPENDLLRDAAFAWIAAKHLKSNAIVITAGGRMLGGGMGQVDRVTACTLAARRAAEGIAAAKAGNQTVIAASDAFFPFPDGPRILIEAGVMCLVHTGGSIRDEQTTDLCRERNVTCLLTGVRHFRH